MRLTLKLLLLKLIPILGIGVGIILAVAGVALLSAALIPYGLGRWLRHLMTRRFVLTNRKRLQCMMVGLLFLLLPVLLWRSESGYWRALLIWSGVILGMFSVVVFLFAEAFRQAVWPRLRTMVKARNEAARLRTELSSTTAHLESTQVSYGAILAEQRELRQLVSEIIRTNDTAFYSAEHARWKKDYAQCTIEDLTRQMQSLQQRLSGVSANFPEAVTHTLQAATVRLLIHDRIMPTLTSETESSTDACLNTGFLQAKAERLSERIHDLKRIRREEWQAIQKLPRHPISLN